MMLEIGTIYRIEKGNRSGIVKFIGPVLSGNILCFKIIHKGSLYTDYDEQEPIMYGKKQINSKCCKPLSHLEIAVYSL